MSRLRSALSSLVFASSSLALLTGCPSFTTLKTARALDPGQFQITGATEVLGMAAPAGKGVGGVRPSMIVAGRYGVAEGFDVGFKLEPVAGLQGDTTIQLARGAVDVAFGPGVGYFQTPGPVGYAPRSIEQLSLFPMYTVVSATLPLLVGINVGPGHQLVFAPRATLYAVQPQPSQPGGGSVPGGFELFVGGSAGFSIKASRTIRIMPEIAVTTPVTWTGDGAACLGAACAPFAAGVVIVQGGLAITMGADNLGP